MKTPILGGSYEARSRNLAYNRMINMYLQVMDKKSGKAPGMILGTPGTVLLGAIGNGPIRGAIPVSGYGYVVSGPEVYKVDPATWTGTLLGTITTASGSVAMIANQTQLLISDGVGGYLVTLSTGAFSTVTSFPSGGQLLVYQDGFGLTNIPGTQQFYQSNEDDLSTWDAANFSSADSHPFNITSMIDLHREVWILTEGGIEIWVNAGLANFVFQRLEGVYIEQGSLAAYAAAKVGDQIVWLSKNKEGEGVVFAAKGYVERRVSTHALEYQISEAIKKGYKITDAFAFPYEQEGHLFYWLNFPSVTGMLSWVLDMKSGYWHERAYFSNGSFTRHPANCHMLLNDKNVVGDNLSGNLYWLDLDTYTDNGNPRKWLRSWRALPPDESTPRALSFESLEIEMQTGINVQPNDSPMLDLRWSDDGGHKWSNFKQRSMGKLGETGIQVRFVRLGSTRPGQGADRIFELSSTANAPVMITGADVEYYKA